jgi:hypothetical protein
VDKSKRDFHLESSSPCIDAGKFTFLSNDIEGNDRTITPPPDLGAYEFK